MYATAKSSRPAAAALALLAVIVSLLAAAAMTDRARAEDKAPARVAMPSVIAVKFHADWCGSCKAMGPVFEDLTNKFDGKPILFITLNMTNTTTRHQAEYLAAALGQENHWARLKSKTGIILLVDGFHKSELATLTAKQNIKEMGAELTKAVETVKAHRHSDDHDKSHDGGDHSDPY